MVAVERGSSSSSATSGTTARQSDLKLLYRRTAPIMVKRIIRRGKTKHGIAPIFPEHGFAFKEIMPEASHSIDFEWVPEDY